MKKVWIALMITMVLALSVCAITVSADSALSAVTLDSAKATSNTCILVSWTDPSSDNHNYKIYRAESKDGPYTELTNSWYTSYYDNTVTPGKTYYYKVCKYTYVYDGYSSTLVLGQFSNVLSAKAAPPAPYFSATLTDKKKITLLWYSGGGKSVGSESVDGYVIYRASSKDGTYKHIKTIKDPTINTYEDTSVSSGKTYYYKMRAFVLLDGERLYGAKSDPVRNKVDVSLCQVYFTKIGELSEKVEKYSKYIQVRYGDTVLKENKDYTIWHSGHGWSGDTLNHAYVTIYGCSDSNYTSSHRFTVNTIDEKAQIYDVSITNSGVEVSWKSAGGVGYKVYRKVGNGDYSRIKTITDNTITSWVDESADKTNTTYKYFVKVYTKKGSKTLYTERSDIKSIKRISTPKLKSVSNKKVGIVFKWGSVKGAKSYEVMRKSGKGDWEFLAHTTDTQYTDTTAEVGTTYKYTVYCKDVEYQWGGQKISRYNSSGLTKERKVAAEGTSLSDSSVKLTWNKASKADGYAIYRATSEKGTYKKIKTIKDEKTVTYTDKKLTFGKYYYYKVRPYTVKDGKTVYGSYGTLLKTRATVGVSTVKKAKASTFSKVKVTWDKVSKASGYQVYVATSKDGTYKKAKTITSGSTTSYTVSKLENGKTYYFKVRAYRTKNKTNYYGSYSSVKSCFIDVLGYEYESYDSKVRRIWESDEYKGYTSSSAAKKDMKTIKIKTWDINSKGKKYTRYYNLTVHKNIADTVKQIFTEIYNGKEKFPIKDIGGFGWRNTGIYSQHGAGVAIDINPNENAQFKNGKPVTGSFWKPDKNPYSIKPDGDVVKAFEKYGFVWGAYFGDYMHFSYFGT